MARLLEVLIVLAFCVAGTLQSTPYNACKGAPAPLDLRVKDCNSFPCPFKKGTNVTADWDFVVTSNTATLAPRVRATVLGVTVDYPLPEKNACNSLTNAECPLAQGEQVTYHLSMPILSSYPAIRLKVEFALIDQSGNPQVCFSVDARVIK